MRYCRRCVEIICEDAPGGVGKCPTCRSFLRKAEAGGFETCDEIETCNLCNQPRQIVQRLHGGAVKLCDACFLGARQQLRYECERCGRLMQIPHPMYRYQALATEFGNNTWFCRGEVGGVGCNDFTNWRVCASDAHLVPAEDAPEGWGLREEWIARVREQRRRELRGEVPERGINRQGAIGFHLTRFLDSGWLLGVLLVVLWLLRG